MNFNSFVKEWFTLAEMGQFLRNQYKINHTKKNLLRLLNNLNLVEFYIYLEGGCDIEELEIGRNRCDVIAFDLKDPLPNAGYSGSLAQLEDFAQQNKGNTIYFDKDERIYIVIEPDQDNNALFPSFFKGLFNIPPSVFNEINFLFSEENTLYLPEKAIYSSFELVDNPAQENAAYNFNFLYIEFSHAQGQGAMNIDDIKIYLPAERMSEFINHFQQTTTTETTEETQKTGKTVKNKSNKKAQNPTDKKKVIEPAVLESIKRTAEANPHLGGYQIINAVIAAMKSEQRYIETDFFTPEAYLKKVKSRYGITFPRNSGRKKAEVKVILA